MKLSLKIFASVLLAFALAFGFNAFFLHLFERPRIDQILLMAFSTAALGYLLFSFWGTPLKIALPRVNFSWLAPFLKENAPGIALALIFFGIYIYIGLRLNLPHNDTTDNFLDADNYPWMYRIAGADGFNLEMRGPHPFAYFIFRPLGFALNLITQTPSLSAILLNTLAGALCVLFAWMLIKRQIQDSTYAFLIASLLGLSTAHLFFGSVIETYIFSAAVMMAFFLLLQSQRSINSLVGVSLLTFGITLTNFVQHLIGFTLQTLRDSKSFWASAKEVVRFTGFTLSIGILLSLLHAAWYPSSKLFFLLSDARAEQEFAYSIFQEPSWRAIGRVILLIRTIFLYAIIAPPKAYVFYADVGGDFPRFNFFKIVPGTFSYSAYDGLGNALVAAWALALLAAGALFVVNLIRAKKTDPTLAFALCVLFNFILHINYGYEPFLYSPDWTYALVFFVALALAPLAKNKFFQGGLLIFLALLAYNQFQLFRFIFETIAPYLN